MSSFFGKSIGTELQWLRAITGLALGHNKSIEFNWAQPGLPNWAHAIFSYQAPTNEDESSRYI